MSNKILQAIGSCLAMILSALVLFSTEDQLMKMLATAIYLKTLSDTLDD